jgi:putative redox protein
VKTVAVEFKNKAGYTLSARLELPVGYKAEHYAVFAHCFTCGKNSKASTVISRQLTLKGIAVLRFDFTGLGQSEGDFGETGFTSNIQDLVSAAAFLKDEYHAPELLIGHSLGGTAVIHAAAQIPSIKAICTIGSPFESSHVRHLLESKTEEIEEKGRARVNIGGRPFEISRSFLEDLEKNSTGTILSKLKKSLLIMHSPQDKIVEIGNAAEIYQAAFHPKSFITLDRADHLLTNRQDSQYAAEVLAAWAQRYLGHSKRENLTTDLQTVVQLGNDGFTTEVVSGDHYLLADEPQEVGGNDMGPSPYQLLNSALGTCTAMTLKLYADRKKWDLRKVTVHLAHEKQHMQDSAQPDSKSSKADVFFRKLEVEGELDKEQRSRLLEIANKCPVHRTLTETEVRIETEYLDD